MSFTYRQTWEGARNEERYGPYYDKGDSPPQELHCPLSWKDPQEK